ALDGRDNAKITISDVTEGGRRRIVIADNGPGIPPEILVRCFDPFVTSKAVGTGLGMSIAQRLAAQNEAFIDVDSDQTGTRVSLIRQTPEQHSDKDTL
ncbi:MAG: ATP-binding protein, partial [Desulfovibrionaceae bacterium]|nr:ATP-binding protein [Desulfovibrionaceae bacterium]